MRIRALLVAIVAFACFVALGRYVLANGEPAALWAWQQSLLNHATLLAWWLTWSCFPYVMIPIAVALLIVAWVAPAWRTRILFSIVMLLLCWRGADLFQHLFARPRRLDWVVKHETSFSYPSSHAAIATGFYALWGVMLYMSELPRTTKAIGFALLLLFAIAICWSRLALGAHYLTDLAGGVLLAVALVSAGLAVFPNATEPPAVAGRRSAAAE
ncbi:MAG: phosphatase PAP2 family protein [Candidatus Cybelea sp.]